VLLAILLPLLAFAADIPPLKSRVTDLTNTLSAQQRSALEQTLAEFEQRKGAQIAVLMVPTTEPETVEQYAVRVQESWKLGRKGVERHIRRIGLYRTKAKNLIAACRLLAKNHAGEVPRTREALEQLPGVGRKTANVVLNTAFGEPTIAVDTHIFRVANRTGIAPGRNVLAVEKRLLKVVPEEFKRDAHHWLILHGRYVCKARKPDCPRCLIRDLCEYRHKTA